MPPPAPDPFPPPGFRRFWTGEAVSGFGTYVALLAIQTLVVVDLDGGATQTGWLNAARWLPYLVLGVVVGALVDRVRRRPVMVATDLARAALLLAIPAAWATGALSLPLLLVLVLGYGTASLINDAASRSFMPRLVPRADLQRAHARLDGADAVGQTAGPALGGVLARAIGAPLTILVTSAGYVTSAIAVATLPTAEPTPTAPRRGLRSLLREIGDGLRWVYGPSGLRLLAVMTHVSFIGYAVLGVVLAPFALRALGLSAAAFGIATGAAGVGALLGAVVSTAVGRRIGTGGAIIAAHATTALALVLTTAALLADGDLAAAVVLAGGQALYGFAIGLSNSHEMAFRQVLTPDELQARTNTTMRSLNRAVVVVVSPVVGVLADRAGLGAALLGAAVVFAAVAAVLAAISFRRVRLDPGGDP